VSDAGTSKDSYELGKLQVREEKKISPIRSCTNGVALFLFDLSMVSAALYGALAAENLLLNLWCAIAAGFFVCHSCFCSYRVR
jgi:hypothetical protein